MRRGITARLTVKPDCIDAFETAFKHYQHTVRSNEPGNVFFQLHRISQTPGAYLVMEQYADQAALEAHRSSPHYLAIPATFGSFMAGPPDIQVYDAVE